MNGLVPAKLMEKDSTNLNRSHHDSISIKAVNLWTCGNQLKDGHNIRVLLTQINHYKAPSTQVRQFERIRHKSAAKKLINKSSKFKANPREEISFDQHKMPNKLNILLKLTKYS